MISEKIFKKKNNDPMGANDPHGVVSLGPLGMVGRVLWILLITGQGQFTPQGLDWPGLCMDHYTFLHTKYMSCGPHGFREDFSSFYPL